MRNVHTDTRSGRECRARARARGVPWWGGVYLVRAARLRRERLAEEVTDVELAALLLGELPADKPRRT